MSNSRENTISIAGDLLAPPRSEGALLRLLAASRHDPIEDRLRALIDNGFLELSRPGTGLTWERFSRLAEIAAEDLSLSRLAEGHADALAILDEWGMTAREHGETDRRPVYGVWVAGEPLKATSRARQLLLSGHRDYCSGAGIVETALVTSKAEPHTQPTLFEIDARHQCILADANSWPSVGMATTRSVRLDLREVPALRQIGPAGWYQNRPGFWQGSLNVAACWYGGALGLARTAMRRRTSLDSFALVLRGRIDAAVFEMRLALSDAADALDTGAPGDCERLALRVRDCVYRNCQVVIDAAAELGGTFGSTRDGRQATRLADLPVYLRQYHPMRDRERLGTFLTSPREEA